MPVREARSVFQAHPRYVTHVAEDIQRSQRLLGGDARVHRHSRRHLVEKERLQ